MPDFGAFLGKASSVIKEKAESMAERVPQERIDAMAHAYERGVDIGASLRPGGSRQAIGYAGAAVVGGGMAIGAVSAHNDGNNFGAGVLGSGAAVIGTAVMLSRPGAVAKLSGKIEGLTAAKTASESAVTSAAHLDSGLGEREVDNIAAYQARQAQTGRAAAGEGTSAALYDNGPSVFSEVIHNESPEGPSSAGSFLAENFLHEQYSQKGARGWLSRQRMERSGNLPPDELSRRAYLNRSDRTAS